MTAPAAGLPSVPSFHRLRKHTTVEHVLPLLFERLQASIEAPIPLDAKLQICVPEIRALPVVWLLKRVCHYPRRGFADAPETGLLNVDADGRTGVLLWSYFLEQGAIRPVENGFDIDAPLLARASERLLDEWIEIEGRIEEGVEPYAAASARFTARYGSVADTGGWIIPEELRRCYARVLPVPARI